MIVNSTQEQMEMEARDINYILPSYATNYLFISKNKMPKRIIFPMFPSVRIGNTDVPIEYVPPISPVATEITQDGSNVPEVTEAQETALDEKDERIKGLLADIEEMKGEAEVTPAPEDLIRQQEEADIPVESDTPAVEATQTDRQPIQPPGGDIGPGQGPSDMHPRDRRDQTRMARDLASEPDIEESKEKEFEKTISRDALGRPIVEDKPNEDT